MSVAPFVASNLWDGETATDFPCELVRYLHVPRHRLNFSSLRVGPKRMFAAFSFQVAAVLAQVSQQKTRASLQDNRFANRILRNTAQSVFSPIFKNQFDGAGQILPALLE